MTEHTESIEPGKRLDPSNCRDEDDPRVIEQEREEELVTLVGNNIQALLMRQAARERSARND